jgi:tetratricopeptide (TPR) repeat protein
MIFHRPLASSLYSNLGAVQMAKVELADFPSGKWEWNDHRLTLDKIQPIFLQALLENPNNPTANYRLGLIALQKQDFSSAINFLQQAYHVEPGHPGIRKTLGLGFAWLGRFDQAQALLKDVPEARDEMSAYSYYWQISGREDLSQNALSLLDLLEKEGAS